MSKADVTQEQIDERIKDINDWENIAGLDNDAPIHPEFKKLEERYINFELNDHEFYKEGVKLIVKLHADK